MTGGAWVQAARAAYAARFEETRGRAYPEPRSRMRTAFQRDRDRIIHSTAFRRLKHKTQVFVAPEGDHYRTRLTHSLEVAQIARAISRALGLDEDLTEALALAHDFGHTPFGHAGERALDEAMRPFGGFDHNDHTIRVVTRLERRHPLFDGLNLCWETLEGLVKHNGPLAGPNSAGDPVPRAIARLDRCFPLRLDTQPGLEAQVAALADDIAYDNHDLDDGLRADYFRIPDLEAVPHVHAVFAAVQAAYPDLDDHRTTHEAVRRLIGGMVEDLLAETGRRIAAARPADADAVRLQPEPLVAFSPAMQEKERLLKAFLYRHLYRHERVTRQTETGRMIVRELFDIFMDDPTKLPAQWGLPRQAAGTDDAARVVADFIAGMTDRYAATQHERLISQRRSDR